MTRETITALMVAPDMNPCVIQLYNDAKFLKSAVSMGLIDTAEELNLYPLGGQAGILCCKYAAVWGGKVNRRIGKRVFAGTFFVVGIHGERLVSLSRDALETYRLKFWTPLEFTPEDDTNSLLATIDALWSDDDTL